MTEADRVSFVILTGLSGAGKSHAIKCFEDLGFFCVDNLPTTLIPTFADLIARSRQDVRRVALGVDVREGEYLSHLLEALHELNDRIRGVAERTPQTAVADAYRHFLGHGVTAAEPDRWYWKRAWVEPNARGASEIRRLWLDALDALAEN